MVVEEEVTEGFERTIAVGADDDDGVDDVNDLVEFFQLLFFVCEFGDCLDLFFAIMVDLFDLIAVEGLDILEAFVTGGTGWFGFTCSLLAH